MASSNWSSALGPRPVKTCTECKQAKVFVGFRVAYGGLRLTLVAAMRFQREVPEPVHAMQCKASVLHSGCVLQEDSSKKVGSDTLSRPPILSVGMRLMT